MNGGNGDPSRNGGDRLRRSIWVAAVLLLCLGITAGYNLSQSWLLLTTSRLVNAVAEIQQGRGDRIGKIESKMNYIEERVQKNESRAEYLERTIAELRSDMARMSQGRGRP